MIPQRMEEVVSALKALDEVRWIVFTTGKYPLMLEVLTRDYDDLSEFLMNRLNRIESITSTQVITVLKKLKSRFNFIR
ncbi:AsnC family protein [Melghirimyces thermohalophilus]|uniref:AsnC family protein n=1 Tax=Melghirimyces thermohalophilus TaxID=1236220 RepID=A0A1G6ITQ7_9BACL|nr:Lrp/AsnC ligand binding domain-containing protein [Melghirimyces thermohalophilus]SDC09844.1 AsnC family protein [Melghirimyces thermohalophilus]